MPGRLSSLMIACCAAALIGGCGSSGGGASTSATEAAGSAGTTTTATAKGSSGSPTATVKVDASPNFARPSASAPVQSGVVQISYRNISIAPDTARVKLGSTVRWTNYDSTQCNVTSVGGPQRIASKSFGQGGSFEVKLVKPGVIHYVCTPYPATMNGTIEVVG
jgi:plastocyanin